MTRILSCLLFIFYCSIAQAQIRIFNSPVSVFQGTNVGISDNCKSDADILGSGKLILNGTVHQIIDFSGHTVKHIVIQNNGGIILNSNIRVDSLIEMNAGIMKTNGSILTLSATANSLGGSDSSFIETDSIGAVIKQVDHNLNAFEVLIGNNNKFRPVFIQTTGSYNNAAISLQSFAATPSERPNHLNDYLLQYWKFQKTGINGNTTITGKYNNSSDIYGNEAHLRGYLYNGTDWTSSYGSVNPALHTTSSLLTSDSGVLYAMNKFILMGARAFLQGPYDPSTGLMNDDLRSPSPFLPNQDPYRNSPYSTSFTQVNNPTAESIIGQPFADHYNMNDNIVDWVFLQLRNTIAPIGNQVLATRSALIQRDGDIVDIDGKSPVTFNEMSNGVYSISVRHRNHLSLSQNPASSNVYLNESSTNAITNNVIDLRTHGTNELFGSTESYTTGFHPQFGRVSLLKAGNTNCNSEIRYAGANNDKSAILNDLNKDPAAILIGYYRSDLNMDGMVKFSGYLNDRSYLLSEILNNDQSAIIREEIPQ